MKHGRMIFILGDVHGDFGALNTFINKHIRNNSALRTVAPWWEKAGDDFQIIILQVGDFAWFWSGCDSRKMIQNRIDWLPAGQVPIYWTGGNHEDWDELDRLGPGIAEVDRGIFYCPFGSTLEVSPDLTVLFAGGAESADKEWRLEEMARGAPKIWWEQEGILASDIDRLMLVPKADWVVSHTAPNSFDIASQMRGFCGHFHEPSRKRLDAILVDYKPKRWFFGHFHQHMEGSTDGCQWECLATLGGSSKSWDKIWMEWED